MTTDDLDQDDDEDDDSEIVSEPVSDTPSHHSITIAQAGRLDAAIAAQIAELSRAHVQRLIEGGHVTVAASSSPMHPAVATKANHKVRDGDVVEVLAHQILDLT